MGILINFLIFAPLLFRWKNIGFLHPLIFPILIGIAKSIFSTGGKSLLTPFFLQESSDPTLAFSLNSYEILEVQLFEKMLTIVGLLFFYFGYFSFRKKFSLKFNLPHIKWININPEILLPFFSIILLSVIYFFLESQGGISNYISSWGLSRRDATQKIGAIVGPLKYIYLVPLTWYLLKGEKIFTNPIFLSIFFISIFSGFIVSGGRSTILNASLPFIIVFIFNNKKIPWIFLTLFGIGFFLLFGLLGKLRSSVYDKEVDWEVLTEANLQEAVNSTIDEAAVWNKLGANTAVFHSVPSRVDYLYGKAYLSVFLYWLPRSIYPDKPHGTGYYVGRDIYRHIEGGIPPGEIADIFFNFGIIGVIIILFLKGMFIRWITGLAYQAKFSNLLFLIPYLIMFDIKFTPLSLVQAIQQITFFILLIQFIKIEPFSKFVPDRIAKKRHQHSV